MAALSVIVVFPLFFVKQKGLLNTSKPVIPPLVVLLIGLCAVSAASIFIRYAQGLQVPSLVIAAYRLNFATLILLPIVLTRHRAELKALTPRQVALAAVSGVFLAAHFGTWITSLAYTSVANSAVFVSVSPLFVAFIAVFVLREKLSRALAVGLLVTLAGGVIVALSDACTTAGCPPLSSLLAGQAFVGNALALAGAATVAVYFIIGKTLRASLSLMVYIFLTYGMAALTLLLTVLVLRLPLSGYPAEAYLWFLLLAVAPQLIGHSAFNWALKYLPTTYVSLITLCEPIGSTLLAVWLLGETPTPLKVGGGALILLGIGLASRRQS